VAYGEQSVAASLDWAAGDVGHRRRAVEDHLSSRRGAVEACSRITPAAVRFTDQATRPRSASRTRCGLS